MQLPPLLLEIKESTLSGCGKGLFTKVFIPKGTIITEYIGKITTWKMADKAENNPYLFYVTRNHVINAKDEFKAYARFANDARGFKRIAGLNNNSAYMVINKQVFIKATKNIPTNSEIFVGYGKEYWDIMKENNVF